MARYGVLLALVGLALCTSALADTPAADPKLTVRLIDLLVKKDWDAFTAELAKDGMDANQPDSRSKLPIVEAVKTREARYVDALIQFSALVNAKEPNTGATPVQIAFAQNSVEIARTLLGYGADPNVADKAGKKARDFAPSAEIRELLRLFDDQGAMAFEDAPGTWVKAKNDKGEPYWYNVVTQEARWNVPPSCGWQRVEYQGQPSKYVNYVTGQTVHRAPAAVAWRKVRVNAQDLWYNWAINKTQHEQPDEMPQYLIDEALQNTNIRWYNDKTKEFAWEDPKLHSPWRPVKDEKGEYFYNVLTGESTWDAPEEMAWSQVESEAHKGRFYWFNKKTGESTWDKPQPHAWEKHDHDIA